MRFLLFVIFLSLTVPTASYAEEKIAIVNLKKILKESTAAQSIQKQIEKKKKNIQSEISTTEEELVERDKELASQRTVLSEDAFDKKVKTFQKEVVAAQRDVQLQRSKLEEAYTTALGDVEKEVTKIIKELAKTKGFNVAVPRTHVLYSDDSIDISDEVLTMLNKRLPDVKVKL